MPFFGRAMKREEKEGDAPLERNPSTIAEYCESHPVSKEVLLELFGLDSMQTVYTMKNAGTIESCGTVGTGKKAEHVYDLWDSARRYIRHLRDRASSKAGDKEQARDAADADIRYRNAKADKMELELAELRGRMHSSEDVEAIVGDMIARMRAEILSLPGGLAKDVTAARTPAEAAGIIKAAVNDLLNRMSEYRYDNAAFRRKVRQREKWMNEHEETDGGGRTGGKPKGAGGRGKGGVQP